MLIIALLQIYKEQNRNNNGLNKITRRIFPSLHKPKDQTHNDSQRFLRLLWILDLDSKIFHVLWIGKVFIDSLFHFLSPHDLQKYFDLNSVTLYISSKICIEKLSKM